MSHATADLPARTVAALHRSNEALNETRDLLAQCGHRVPSECMAEVATLVRAVSAVMIAVVAETEAEERRDGR